MFIILILFYIICFVVFMIVFQAKIITLHNNFN